MIPIWARRFEPASVTGLESQDAMETLIKIARYTGERRYLTPVPRALAYLRKCLLPDGRLARFYELGTDKPLYMDAEYRLTYDDSAAPAHYGWKVRSRLDDIERAYKEAEAGAGPPAARRSVPSEAEVRRIIGDLDEQGRWVMTVGAERPAGQPKFPPMFRYLSSAVFNRNVEALAAYLAAGRP
jgi:hypothetical protein